MYTDWHREEDDQEESFSTKRLSYKEPEGAVLSSDKHVAWLFWL